MHALEERNIDEPRRRRTAVFLSVFVAVASVIRALSFWAMGGDTQVAIFGAIFVVAVTCTLLLRRRADLSVIGLVLVGSILLGVTTVTVAGGGLRSGSVLGLALVPFFATVLGGARWGFLWLVLTWLDIVFLLVADLEGLELGTSPTEAPFHIVFLSAILVPLVIYGAAAWWEWARVGASKENIRLQRERIAAVEEINMIRADRMVSLGQLAGGLAHEINNPLSFAVANLEYLREAGCDGNGEVDKEAVLTESLAGLRRIAAIAKDLQTFSQVPDERPVPVNVASVFSSVLRVASAELRYRAKVREDFDEAAPFLVASEGQLRQALLNLVINAAQSIDVGDDGRNWIRCTVATAPDNGLVVEVADSGRGMSAEVLKQAQTPFFTTKPAGTGSGLGLPMVANLTAQLGGELDIVSDEGVGTTVRLCFPAHATTFERPPVSDVEELVLTAPGWRILIVDDEEAVARAVARVLSNHDTVVAHSGTAALRLIAGGPPFDAVLCDVMMPELDGADLYEAVVALGSGDEDRMIFMSGGVMDPDLHAILQHMPNRLLAKPLEPRQLFDAIASVTEGRSESVVDSGSDSSPPER